MSRTSLSFRARGHRFLAVATLNNLDNFARATRLISRRQRLRSQRASEPVVACSLSLSYILTISIKSSRTATAIRDATKVQGAIRVQQVRDLR